MARKSRFSVQKPVSDTAVIYNTAGYVRLSDQDRGEGASIENQEIMVRKYIEQTPGLRLCTVFADNGATGADFNRSGFKSLMDAIRNGVINCVVVKDLSRFGRDYIEAGNYIEIIFPRLGVRFVSIGDGFDSNDPHCRADGMSIALKNMINSFYIKDISVKTRTAKEALRHKGKYAVAVPPLGYVKSEIDRHKLVIDPEAAEIVRDIFRWKLEGLRLVDIRRRLNDNGVPSPAHYRYIKGIHKDKRWEKPVYWHITTIKEILGNTVYLGHMALGKCTVDPNVLHSRIRRRKDEWVITENTHEPIITQEEFDTVNGMMRPKRDHLHESSSARQGTQLNKNIFSGLTFCADCGHAFIRIPRLTSKKTEIKYVYICLNCKQNAPDRADRRYFKEQDFIDTVYSVIREQINVYTDMRELANQVYSSQSVSIKHCDVEQEIHMIRTALERFPVKNMRLYDDYCEGILSESDYKQIKERYAVETTEYAKRLTELQTNAACLEPEYVEKNTGVMEFERFMDKNELTCEMLTALVNRIDVSGSLSVNVSFKYRDEYEKLATFLTENGGTGR